MPLHLHRIELNAILAGLRWLQTQMLNGHVPPGIEGILTDNLPEGAEPIQVEAIDDLCESLATSPAITVLEDSP